MNETIFFSFYHLSHLSNLFDSLVIFVGVYFPYIVAMLAGLFLLFHHEVLQAESPFQVLMEKKREFIIFISSVGLALVLAEGLKFLLHTPRPYVLFSELSPLFRESGYAFPSGHATVFAAFAFAIFFVHKKAGFVFMLFALLIGLARIIGGVHFPGDILGGFFLGAISAYLVTFLAKNVYPHT